MVTVEIRGESFPLCLTVAALDQVNEKCGSLSDVVKFVTGGGNAVKAVSNTAWMLGILITEGEENRLMEARFTGEKVERKPMPNSDDLSHFLTPAMAQEYQAPVLQAITEGLSKSIEADNSKNADQAGGA